METTLLATEQPAIPRQEFFRVAAIAVGALLLTGCTKRASDDPDPTATQKIDFMVQLNDKANEGLKAQGGYVIVNNVLVAHTQSGQFVAVGSTCTHEGTKLVYRAAENQFYCPLDLSRYDVTGKVIAGPAVKALVRYTVASDLTAGVVRVSN